jgi:cytochrome c-type biogenesis protein CcmH
MSYLPIIALAAVAFLVAALALRLPRGAWSLVAATLLFGLAGYAVKGSPGQAGAPKATNGRAGGDEGAALVASRRALYGPAPPNSYVTMSDGFARRGRFADAAALLRQGVTQNPRDAEAWLALANALVEHADGEITPAAVFAYERAQSAEPANPGPALFLGVALIRTGRMQQARALWADVIARAPADAPWRAGMQERLDRLDVLIAQMGTQ